MGDCSYEEALAGLYSLAGRLPPRQYLRGMRALLERLNNPQEDFESAIVTGTNGKGSTAAMVQGALSESGRKAGLYLSPHVDDIRERITINGAMISKKRFGELYSEVLLKSRRTEPVTFFEFLTSMMFLCFSEERVDCAALEVGLGGRLDATNVARSKLGAITEVGLDHTGVLGKTLFSIATEKAGIIREGGILVTGEGKRDPLKTINEICRKKRARLLKVGRDITFEEIECTDKRNAYRIRGLEGSYNVSLSMLGAHQGKNAAVAAGIAEQMGVGANAIERGIGRAKLPCRLEVVSRKPLVVMDCAHNPHAASALSESLKLFGHKRMILVCGMMMDKDQRGFLREIGQKANVIVVNEPNYERAAGLGEIFKVASEFCGQVIGIKDVRTSLKAAKSLAGPDDLVLAAGSIYMLSEARGNKAGVTQ